jgi:hypothetical protein
MKLIKDSAVHRFPKAVKKILIGFISFSPSLHQGDARGHFFVAFFHFGLLKVK